MAEDAPATPAELHPLASVRETISTWTHWKEQWGATMIAEHKLILLHYGFTIDGSTGDCIDRICFYLDVANGHTSSLNFRLSDEQAGWTNTRFLDERMSWSDVRQSIARKAFEMVANTLFKNRTKGSGDYPSWSWIVGYPELLDKVLWFFRVNDELRIDNLPYAYGGEEGVYSKITHTFLAELANLAWMFSHFGKYTGKSDHAIQEQLAARRPKFIEILCGIGELGRLFDQQYKLDKACMAKLEELAFRRKLWLPTEEKGPRGSFWRDAHRKPATLAEAHYGGSMPAIVLTHRRIVAQEQERFEKLRELSERRDELEREQASLQPTA